MTPFGSEARTKKKKVLGSGQMEALGNFLIGKQAVLAETIKTKIACSMKLASPTPNGGISSVRDHTSFCAVKRSVEARAVVCIL